MSAEQVVGNFDFSKQAIDWSLLDRRCFDVYRDLQAIPVSSSEQGLVIATAQTKPSNQQKIRAFFGKTIMIQQTSHQHILSVLSNEMFAEVHQEYMNGALYHYDKKLSAKNIFSWRVYPILLLLTLVLLLAFSSDAIYTLLIINTVLICSALTVRCYKCVLCFLGLYSPAQQVNASISTDNLPIYSVLIPLYQENRETIQQLLDALNKLDYPKEKLDIKLLLEADDQQSQQHLQALEVKKHIQVLVVPDGEPKTKPRACNYGLSLAIGEYVTVFDAEDKPEPDQLKKVLAGFAESADDVICIQSKLTYYNSRQNILTRLFTIEYALFFDLLLPGLAYFKAPIPLGGTSNHFKTAYLRKIKAWDPYNVTEDADLGVRISRFGYRVKLIETNTAEEANAKLSSWIKQRSRWIKGYLITYIIHMRQPIKLIKQIGIGSFLHFQLFVGGTILTAASNLLLWTLFFVTLILHDKHIDPLFTSSLILLAYFNFFVANFLLFSTNIFVVIKRGLTNILWVVPLLLFYYMLHTIASYIAIYELFFKPYYWYKTPHTYKNNAYKNSSE